MPAYLVGTIRITDDSRWQQYVKRVGATFTAQGGKVLFRAVSAAQLNGQAHGDRIVVAEFADLQALKRWHDSAEYQDLIALREAGADVVLTAYET